ncbi:MAG: hypothetical protein GC191_13735 [Azospirillum sp.]|nr:hypothetical protein [Azospirillum sp.]
MSDRTRLLILGLLQSAALLIMIGQAQWTLATGTPVLLATEPVDPRSLFQGDYVVLRYEISRLSPAQLAGDRDGFAPGSPVYVVLRPGPSAWRAAAAYRERPASAAGVILRGEVERLESACPTDAPSECAPALEVTYGIETWFVPEGTGHALERLRNQRQLAVRAAIDRSGRAGILELVGTEDAK